MLTRLRAGLGLAVAQLRHYRVRTVLVVVAVALAVLSTTLLASVSVGVVAAGTETLDAANRDVWVSGGATRITASGVENAIVDSHAVAAEIRDREDVRNAAPIAYQTVYVGTDPDDLRTIVGVGIPGGGGSTVAITEGRSFEGPDVHYAGGNYTGPMTHEVVVSPRVAAQLNASVGDSLYVGAMRFNWDGLPVVPADSTDGVDTPEHLVAVGRVHLPKSPSTGSSTGTERRTKSRRDRSSTG